MPNCDLCSKPTPATKDAKLYAGPWAFVCDDHFKSHAIKTKGLSSDLKKG